MKHAKILIATLALVAPLASLAALKVVPLGDQQFKAVVEGEAQQEVRLALGAPTSVYERDGEPHYVYNFTDTWGMPSVCDIAFDSSGHVDGKVELRVQDE